MMNTQSSQSLRVHYADIVPFFCRLYFHTLRVAVNNTELDPADIFTNVVMKPGEDRGSPSLLEVDIVIPPSSTITISYQFEKVFLSLEEHPPDPSRGLDMPASVATYFLEGHVRLPSHVDRGTFV